MQQVRHRFRDFACSEFNFGRIHLYHGSGFAWLCSAERTYPVTIDPDIKLNFKNNVENTYVDKNLPDTICSINSTAPGALRLSSKQNILIRLNELPGLNAGDVIVSAAINLTRYGKTRNEPRQRNRPLPRAVRLVGRHTDMDALLRMEQQQYPADKSRVFSLAMSSAERCNFFTSVTDLFKKWHSGVMKSTALFWRAAVPQYTTHREPMYHPGVHLLFDPIM